MQAAMSENNITLMQTLITCKADVNAVDGDGETAVAYCATPDNLLLLIRAKVDVDIPKSSSPINTFVRMEDPPFVRILLAAKADVSDMHILPPQTNMMLYVGVHGTYLNRPSNFDITTALLLAKASLDGDHTTRALPKRPSTA